MTSWEIRCGDVVDELTKMALVDEFIDVAITSPPYNLGKAYGSWGDTVGYREYLGWSYGWLKALRLMTRDGGRFCLNVPLDTSKHGHVPQYADMVQVACSAGWKYRHTIVWNEQNISRSVARGSFAMPTAPNVIAPVEMIVVFYTGEWKRPQYDPRRGVWRTWDITNDECVEWTNGVWTFPGESAKRIGHPSPFPVELPRRLLKLYSFREDLVCDPFAGSGTTLVAATGLGRRSVGIDSDPAYCEAAVRRLKTVECPTASLKGPA